MGRAALRRISGLINTLIAKVFGTKNERVVKSLMPQVQAINALEPQMQKLTDAELRAKTEEFRRRIQERLSRFSSTPETEIDPDADAEPDPDRQKRLAKEQYDALQEALNENLGESCAVVRQAGRRARNMRPFGVRLSGGIV